MNQYEKRKLGLSLIIMLLALSNIAGIFKLQINADILSEMYTFLSPDEIIWLSIIPVATMVSLAGIWFGKKPGLISAAFIFIVILILDIYYKVWPHVLLTTVGFALLVFLCRQSKQYFGFDQNK